MKNVIIYSAGLDSYFLRHYLKYTKPSDEFIYVYYDIKSKYSVHEIQKLNYQMDHENVKIDIDETFNFKFIEDEKAFIPHRNLHFALNATKYADNVYIGGTLSDRVSDNNKKIFDDLSLIASESLGKRIVITSPFWEYHKADVANFFYKRQGIDFAKSILNSTFSCYYPIEKYKVKAYSIDGFNYKEYYEYETHECMKCPACFRKNAILSYMNIFVDFKSYPIINKYEVEYQNSIQPNERQIVENAYIKLLGKFE